MAILSVTDREEIAAEYSRAISTEREPLAVNKANLRAAVAALDQYLQDNAASINTTIPLPARTALTTPQKARLLMFVIQRRYIVGA